LWQTGQNAAAMGCGMVGCKQDGMLHCGDGLWYGGVQTGRNAAVMGCGTVGCKHDGMLPQLVLVWCVCVWPL